MPNIISATLNVTGWSKATMAQRLSVHKGTIQDWAQGRTEPRSGVYKDLRRELTIMHREIGIILDQMLPPTNED